MSCQEHDKDYYKNLVQEYQAQLFAMNKNVIKLNQAKDKEWLEKSTYMVQRDNLRNDLQQSVDDKNKMVKIVHDMYSELNTMIESVKQNPAAAADILSKGQKELLDNLVNKLSYKTDSPNIQQLQQLLQQEQSKMNAKPK